MAHDIGKKHDLENLHQQIHWSKQHLGGIVDFASRFDEAPELAREAKKIADEATNKLDAFAASIEQKFGKED